MRAARSRRLAKLTGKGQSVTRASAASEPMIKTYTKENMGKRMIGEYMSAIDDELMHKS
jgi:hypothetical protein